MPLKEPFVLIQAINLDTPIDLSKDNLSHRVENDPAI